MYERSFLEWMQKLELLESYFFYLDKLHIPNTYVLWAEHASSIYKCIFEGIDILKHFLAIL